MDHLIYGYLAGMGRHGTDLLDSAMATLGVADAPKQPAKGLLEQPAIRGLFQSPYAATADVERFYRGARMAEETSAMLSQSRMMDTKRRMDWIRKNKSLALWYSQSVEGKPRATWIRNQKATLSSISKAAQAVKLDRDIMSREEKREKLIELSKQRNEIAKSSLMLLHPKHLRAVR